MIDKNNHIRVQTSIGCPTISTCTNPSYDSSRCDKWHWCEVCLNGLMVYFTTCKGYCWARFGCHRDGKRNETALHGERPESLSERALRIGQKSRCSTKQRHEVYELDWAVALQQLIELIQDALKQTSKAVTKLIKRQLQQWISGLPSYIKAYLPISVCESWVLALSTYETS